MRLYCAVRGSCSVASGSPPRSWRTSGVLDVLVGGRLAACEARRGLQNRRPAAALVARLARSFWTVPPWAAAPARTAACGRPQPARRRAKRAALESVEELFTSRRCWSLSCLGRCLTGESRLMLDAGRDRLALLRSSQRGGRDWHWWRCRSSSSGIER